MWLLLRETASISVEEVFHCVWSESLSERTLSFAATQFGVNVAFARVWFGNEWIYVILVWRASFSKHGGGCWDVFAIVVEVEDI